MQMVSLRHSPADDVRTAFRIGVRDEICITQFEPELPARRKKVLGVAVAVTETSRAAMTEPADRHALVAGCARTAHDKKSGKTAAKRMKARGCVTE
jgi:hypothetical protein